MNSPVALPCVSDVRVVDVVFVGLLVQEVKHVLDGQRQGTAPMGRAEYGLEQVVHKLLQCTLWSGKRGDGITQRSKPGMFFHYIIQEGMILTASAQC